MLDLDSAKWSEYAHAHGAASDVPDMIRRLASAESLPQSWKQQPWFDLWDSLLHQGDVSDPAFAVVPHIVALAEQRDAEERIAFFEFAGWAAAGRNEPIPEELQGDFEDACATAAVLIYDTLLVKEWSYEHTLRLLGALGAVKGMKLIGRHLMQLSQGELQAGCPSCGTDLTFAVTAEGLDPPPDDKAEAPGLSESCEVVARESIQGSWGDAQGVQILHGLARREGHPDLANQIWAMAGSTTCPGCQKRVRILEAVDSVLGP